ncbi:MAG: hypothetical protein U1E65_28585 [Myxococcota bacterium]
MSLHPLAELVLSRLSKTADGGYTLDRQTLDRVVASLEAADPLEDEVRVLVEVARFLAEKLRARGPAEALLDAAEALAPRIRTERNKVARRLDALSGRANAFRRFGGARPRVLEQAEPLGPKVAFHIPGPRRA